MIVKMRIVFTISSSYIYHLCSITRFCKMKQLDAIRKCKLKKWREYYLLSELNGYSSLLLLLLPILLSTLLLDFELSNIF